MAYEMKIRGTEDEVKIRSPWAAALLPIITLGIYHLVWWYRINRELRDYGKAKGYDLGQNPTNSVLALFPAKSDLFGAYGIGLFAGFFGYFLVLIILVGVSKNFDIDYFLDGRRKKVAPDSFIPEYVSPATHSMDAQGGAND